jgi:hypothetical protein
VYYRRLFSFPHNNDGNPYPVAFRLSVVVVLFLQNPEPWLLAHSYCPFTKVSQDLVFGWP